MVHRDVPAHLRQSALQGGDAEGADRVGIRVRDDRVGVVEHQAERGVAAKPRRRPSADQVEALRPGREVVDEEPEVLQVPRLDEAAREQVVDFGFGHAARLLDEGALAERLRDGEPVVELDLVYVGSERERAVVDHQAGSVVHGLLGLQRLTAPESGWRRDRRHGAAVRQAARLRVERRGHVERVLLAGRRCAEARTQGGAERHGVGHRPAPGQLGVDRVAEVVELLDPDRGGVGPLLVRVLDLDVRIDGDVGAVPGTGVLGAVAVEAVGARAEALDGVGADFPGRRAAGADPELFVPPFHAGGEVHVVNQRVGDVEVEVRVGLLVDAGAERRGGVVAERGVHRVVDELVDLAGADVRAEVPGHAALCVAANAGDKRRVGQVAAELGIEPAGEAGVEGEAVRIRFDRGQGRRVRRVGDDPERGATAGALDAGPGPFAVADQKRRSAVVAEDAGPGVRIAEVEAAGGRACRVVRVAVELDAAREQGAEVGEHLDVVLEQGRTPDLGWIADVGVAGVDGIDRVGALHAAARRVGGAVLHAQIEEAVLAHGHAQVGGDGVRHALVAGERVLASEAAVGTGIRVLELTRADLDAAAGTRVLELEVDHAGDRV